MTKKQSPPGDLGAAGRVLWRQITAVYVLEAHERSLVADACRMADRVVELEELIATDGLMVVGSQGQPRLHPAVAAVRQTRLAIARHLGRVPFPDELERPVTASSTHARTAALARWRPEPHGASTRRGARPCRRGIHRVGCGGGRAAPAPGRRGA